MDNSERSQILLERASRILENTSMELADWEIGGGTVLAHYSQHRLSKDIDIFIDDVQKLSSISPRFNDAAEDALDYDEMTNYISLTFPEGKVDFIKCAQTRQSFFLSYLGVSYHVYYVFYLSIKGRKPILWPFYRAARQYVSTRPSFP